MKSHNVTYLGGVTLSQENIEHLQTCGVVVNATGADQPKRLGIPGEDHRCVIDAQDIWARVNSRVDLIEMLIGFQFHDRLIQKWELLGLAM